MKKEDLEKVAEEVGLEAGSLKEAHLPWYERLLKISPKLFFRWEGRKLGLGSDKISLADKLFGNIKRIDIEPLSGGGNRGFIIYLDNKLSLWFFQDGDHFIYDGFEIGENKKGDITIFDNLKG